MQISTEQLAANENTSLAGKQNHTENVSANYTMISHKPSDLEEVKSVEDFLTSYPLQIRQSCCRTMTGLPLPSLFHQTRYSSLSTMAVLLTNCVGSLLDVMYFFHLMTSEKVERGRPWGKSILNNLRKR